MSNFDIDTNRVDELPDEEAPRLADIAMHLGNPTQYVVAVPGDNDNARVIACVQPEALEVVLEGIKKMAERNLAELRARKNVQ